MSWLTNKANDIISKQKEALKKGSTFVKGEFKKKEDMIQTITNWNEIKEAVNKHYEEQLKLPVHQRKFYVDGDAINDPVIMPLIAPVERSGTYKDGNEWNNAPTKYTKKDGSGGYRWNMASPIKEQDISCFIELHNEEDLNLCGYESIVWARGSLSEKFKLLGDEVQGRKYGLYPKNFNQAYGKWPNEYDPSELEYFFEFTVWQILEKVK